ncbi:MAG: hypothetical protein M1467_02590 [Deltaproteobacteria bacterium]|nr:hypothetical protein [Deltaproteobacteria bacterium]
MIVLVKPVYFSKSRLSSFNATDILDPSIFTIMPSGSFFVNFPKGPVERRI